VTNDRYVRANEAGFCPDKWQAVYADMHDGDQKEVIISGTSMIIKPSGNSQTWVVNAEFDVISCSASINFNVPGKPNPPPVNLTSTLWYSFTATAKKTEFEFTDPSGTLAKKDYPLNRWVELPKNIKDGQRHESLPTCHPSMDRVFADMHDGDKKAVTISGNTMLISPSGNNQTWVVKAHINTTSCTASIDFNVPGKPNPPPVNLTATLFESMSVKEPKAGMWFTDPSGTLAKSDFPLNEWVQIERSTLGIGMVI